MRVLISAGEASGDLYAAAVVKALRSRHPEAEFFGCAGPRMQEAGVRPVIDMRSIAVLGLVEVLRHIPRIRTQFRRLVQAIPKERPEIAVLTDAPDFHLRLAKRLHRRSVPVVYLIAPQAWAWRPGRVRVLRAVVRRLLCIFPFEQDFFETRGIPTTYVGHPLARLVKPTLIRAELCEKLGIEPDSRILAILPGSRHGVVKRHLPILLEAVAQIRQRQSVTPVLALPPGFALESTNLRERIHAASIKVIEGFTWDVLAQAELALAASGTVTVEAALLGVPMVTFYRVNALSWLGGRWLVQAPYFCMPNLLAGTGPAQPFTQEEGSQFPAGPGSVVPARFLKAGRPIVPELIQRDMTAGRIASEALRLLEDQVERDAMRGRLREIAEKLRTSGDPMEIAAEWIEKVWREGQGSEKLSVEKV